MSQHSTSDRAMREYLSALLEEEQPSQLDTLTRAPLERLLATPQEAPAEPAPAPVEPAPDPVGTALPYVKTALPDAEELKTDMDEFQQEPFQALFFRVAGLNLAVPLKSLGGIHNWETPKPLFGRPPWYLGIMPHRTEQLNVVDSARWVMPEKYTDELAANLDYQYLVMLGESHWGLACEELVTTTALHPNEVQWRTSAGKRPWLAGIVKDKMCALLNVNELIALLEQGLDNSVGS
ncbi:chemotaxis protein CheW [Aliidiomarina taiwanensis]|uniref:Chemotaxis protein CheW n=1 Tax=Aliidiomarina taiwanensis TaxID=946228 RepID=A0A432X867_9GAMM|nr:chemotaxis protein CheW [Aliidiomarina taiwanensis]RUO43053.1 chemotaxis protein CheW [Aliidiomarina taiwanensis]